MGDIEYDERIICRCCGGTTAGKSNLCRECSDVEHDRMHGQVERIHSDFIRDEDRDEPEDEPWPASVRAEQRQEAADGRRLRLPQEPEELANQGDVLEETKARQDELNADSQGTDPGEIPGETEPDPEGGDPTRAEQIDEAADEDDSQSEGDDSQSEDDDSKS